MREYQRPTAAALGVFDGVHLGHRAVLNAVYELYKKKGRLACAFAFPAPTIESRNATMNSSFFLIIVSF